MVVLLLALLVGPVVGTYLCFHDELVSLAAVPGESFPDRSESNEPQARDPLPRSTLFVFARVVVADQHEAGVRRVALGNELGVAGQVADGNQREAVHDDPP